MMRYRKLADTLMPDEPGSASFEVTDDDGTVLGTVTRITYSPTTIRGARGGSPVTKWYYARPGEKPGLDSEYQRGWAAEELAIMARAKATPADPVHVRDAVRAAVEAHLRHPEHTVHPGVSESLSRYYETGDPSRLYGTIFRGARDAAARQ